MKKLFLFALSIVSIIAMSATKLAADTWSTDFEDFNHSAYSSQTTVTINGMEWIIIGGKATRSSEFDWFEGSRGLLLYATYRFQKNNTTFFAMANNRAEGIGTVTFKLRMSKDAVTNHPQAEWYVQSSIDGISWKNEGEPFKATEEVQTIVRKINRQNARIRITPKEPLSAYGLSRGSFGGTINIDDLSITDAEKIDPSKPMIFLDKEVLSFGDIEKGASAKQEVTFTLQAINTEVNATVAKGQELFTVEPASYPAGTNTGKFTVTFAPKDKGLAEGNLVITAGGQSVTVQLQGRCVLPAGQHTFSGGTGTEADPFLISSSDDLVELSAAVKAKHMGGMKGIYFRQTKDIDLGKYSDWPCIGDPNYANNKAPFRGTYDGQNFKIYNLKNNWGGGTGSGSVQGRDYAFGLFGVVAGATIKNVIIASGDLKVLHNGSALVGISFGSTIENCQTMPDVHIVVNGLGSGGIVGGVLSGSYEGIEQPTLVYRCINRAEISGLEQAKSMKAGGIVGSASATGKGDRRKSALTVKECANFGNVSAYNSGVGGIIATTAGKTEVYDCFNAGLIYGPQDAAGSQPAGIIGCDNGNATDPVVSPLTMDKIYNCYNRGKIKTHSEKFSPLVNYMSLSKATSWQLGINNSYYLKAENIPAGQKAGIAKTEAEMKDPTFVTALNNEREGDDAPWRADYTATPLNDGFPILKFMKGTDDDPTAVQEISGNLAGIQINAAGAALEINSAYIGEVVYSVYSVDGICMARGQFRANTLVELPQGKVYVVELQYAGVRTVKKVIL